MNDAHADMTIRCHGETGETNEYGNPEICGTEVTYEDHFHGLIRKREFANKALKLVCPECGKVHKVCPVCEGGGWYRGETTGKQLACHNCNEREATRQMRDPHF